MQLGSITLLPFQVEAVEKFRKVDSVIVADDTGTGKTITCIALVQQMWNLGETGPCLIVTKSFDVWTEHLERMGIDSDKVHVINKKNRTSFIRDLVWMQDPTRNGRACHFYIMHWEALRLIPELQKVKWLCILCDEAHRAKNRKSQQAIALKRIKSKFKIASTATPADNFGQDIWSVLNWLYPKVYTSYWSWVKKYMEYETHYKGYHIFSGMKEEMIPEFLSEIDPFYIARPLSVVDDTVPEYEYYTVFVDMSPEQAQAYKDIAELQMAQIGDDLLLTPTQLESSMRMQQLSMAACGKLLLKKKWVDRKHLVNGEWEIVRVQEDYHSVQFSEPSPKLDVLDVMLSGKDFVVGETDWSMSNAEFHAIDVNEPVVIFSQYRDMVKMACARMDKAGISYTYVMGGEGDADESAKLFQDGKVRVFIATVGAASESITLTRGRYQIYLDRHWSPRVRTQSEGRNRRIGQSRIPICYDIKTRGTVDAVRLDKVRTKSQWLDAMFGREGNLH